MLYLYLICIICVFAQEDNSVSKTISNTIEPHSLNTTRILNTVHYILFEMKIIEYTIGPCIYNQCLTCTILPFSNNSHQCNNIACNSTLTSLYTYKYHDDNCDDFCKFFSLISRLLFYIFVYVLKSSFDNIIINYLFCVIIMYIYSPFGPFVYIAMIWYLYK